MQVPWLARPNHCIDWTSADHRTLVLVVEKSTPIDMMNSFVLLLTLLHFSRGATIRGSSTGRMRKLEEAASTAPKQERSSSRELELQSQYVCVYSELAEGDFCPPLWRERGHASIMRIRTYDADNADGEERLEIDTWGLWPDSNRKIIASGLSGLGSDVRHNFEGDEWTAADFPYIYCEEIDDEQNRKLLQSIEAEAKRFEGWAIWNNCASFAENVFRDVTGTVVESSTWWWGETLCKIGNSIRKLNGGRNMPVGGVPGVGR